jgi:hypothetical protein
VATALALSVEVFFSLSPAFAVAKRVLYFFCIESEAEDMMSVKLVWFTDCFGFLFTFNFLPNSYLVIYKKN